MMREGAQEKEYQTALCKHKTLTGTQTNEAPTKYAIARLACAGHPLEKIVCILTEEAKCSAYKHYCEEITKFCAENNYESPVLDVVDWTVDDSTVDMLTKVLDRIGSISGDDHIVLDTTGGIRSSITMISLLSRFLRYQGANLDFGIYANVAPDHIGDTHEADDLYALLDATNQFAQSGNPDMLEACFEGDNNQDMTDLLKSMRIFYDNMTLCKVDKLENAMKDLSDKLKIITDTPAAPTPSDPKLLVFRKLISAIIEKNSLFSGSKIDYPNIIKWCCNNGSIQQAITIYEEKFPQYLFDKRYISIKNSCESDVKIKVAAVKDGSKNDERAWFCTVFMSSGNPEMDELKRFIEGECDPAINIKGRKAKKACKIISKFKCEIDKHLVNGTMPHGQKAIISQTATRWKTSSPLSKNEKAFLDFVLDHNCKNIKSMLNTLVTDPVLHVILTGKTPPKKKNDLEDKFAFAKRCGHKNFSSEFFELGSVFKDNRGSDKLQNVVYDCIYFKALRNIVNHASAIEPFTESQKRILRKKEYPLNNSITIKSITETMRKAVSRLD
jgi:hypothetical protein